MYSINSILGSSVGSFMLQYPRSVTVLVRLNILNVITYKTFTIYLLFQCGISIKKKNCIQG